MIEVYYRYRVHPAQARAFEHAYGNAGPWAQLFRSADGFVRTRLFRHKAEPAVYVTVHVWREKAGWEAFEAEHAGERARLDRELRMLYLQEHLMGYYEGDEEYREPLDTLA